MSPSCQRVLTVPGGRLTSRAGQRTGQQALPEELERAWFAAALQMLARGLIDTGPLTTAVLPVSHHEKVFAALHDPEQAVKVFLDPRLSPET